MDQADHGGGIDGAAARFGGAREDWLDLSTGINPRPYPLPNLPAGVWTALPDHAAEDGLIASARRFWQVPDGAAVLAAPGASAIIARLPHLARPGRVAIAGPTYNEHARAFAGAGWQVVDHSAGADAAVIVHPNNPDGRWHDTAPDAGFRVIDESFCDTAPDRSLIAQATRPGTVILKSFGKFWGLAGLRLGFAIGDAGILAGLAAAMGPWPVSGPALSIGRMALDDTPWATDTRGRLMADAARLDALMGLPVVGGTPLFRLYQVGDAAAWQTALARHRIWTRVFPYNPGWLRLGLPDGAGWARLARAVEQIRGQI